MFQKKIPEWRNREVMNIPLMHTITEVKLIDFFVSNFDGKIPTVSTHSIYESYFLGHFSFCHRWKLFSSWTRPNVQELTKRPNGWPEYGPCWISAVSAKDD